MFWNKHDANRYVFDNFAVPKILRRGKQQLDIVYRKFFVPAFTKLEITFEPISLPTFYVWVRKNIDPDDIVRHQKGRSALKSQKRNKKNKFEHSGFGTRVEEDGYWEPIALLDSQTFKPIRVLPIHFLAIECFTDTYVGYVTNYETGKETHDFVIELRKTMMYPKPDFQATFNTKNPFTQYMKPTMIYHDGGGAFMHESSEEFIDVANVIGGLSRTRCATDKPFVESNNFTIKKHFTWLLPGSFDDTQKDDIDPKHYSTFAVLTVLEHQILFARYICDDFNHGINKSRGFNRKERWVSETELWYPVMPNNVKELLSFGGLKQEKVITAHIGIRIQSQGKIKYYNSEELRRLRVTLRQEHGKKWDGKVTLIFNQFFPESIRVFDPLEDKVLIVARVCKPKFSDVLPQGEEDFLAQFRESQDWDTLIQKSSEEIIEQAKRRDREIKKYKSDERKRNRARAKVLKDLIAKDTKIMLDALADDDISIPLESIDDKEPTEGKKQGWGRKVDFSSDDEERE